MKRRREANERRGAEKRTEEKGTKKRLYVRPSVRSEKRKSNVRKAFLQYVKQSTKKFSLFRIYAPMSLIKESDYKIILEVLIKSLKAQTSLTYL